MFQNSKKAVRYTIGTALAATVASVIAMGPAILGGAIVLTGPSKAEACKECTFPLRTGDNTWMMPNGQLEVQIQEDETEDDTVVQVQVWLRDAKTKELLAAGHLLRPISKANFQLKLEDRGGTQVKGEIRWVSHRNEIIQAKFACVNSCTIAKFFD